MKTEGPWFDLRTVSAEDFMSALRGAKTARPLVTAWQLVAFGNDSVIRPRLAEAAVTVPDFLNYARLLSTGQARQVAALPRCTTAVLRGVLRAAPVGFQRPLSLIRKEFWTAAELLLRYDLGILPPWHRGPRLLHTQVCDMLFQFDRRLEFQRYLKLLQTGSSSSKVGIHTQQIPMALSCMARWNRIPAWLAYLSVPDDEEGRLALVSAREDGMFINRTLVPEPLDFGLEPESAAVFLEEATGRFKRAGL